ncbi:MAG: acyl-CoA thioesterase [Betaproteobacteria bacterium]|nr:acyl-CoA thioesterase [Betaproteobacteria bacterium]
MNPDQTSGVLLHTLRFPIRWGDMDAMAHVNNTLYLRYFEESRVSWTQSHGMRLRGEGTGMILAKVSVTFKKPVIYPANVVVHLYAGRVGGSSFTMQQTLTVEGETEPSATGECVMVSYDYMQNKAVPVPEKLRAILEGKQG